MTDKSQTAKDEIWFTLEEKPRKLIVKRPSAIDPDCLVAYIEGTEKPLWIVDHRPQKSFVCGLDVYAKPAGLFRRLMTLGDLYA